MMGLREMRWEVSKQINCFDFQLECLTNRKNTLFYRAFGCDRPIKMIDGYDGTVHRGPFQLSHRRQILMNGLNAPRG